MDRLGRIVNWLEETAIAFFLGVMVLITFSQVVARYVFNAGAVWALELTTYAFAWLVLIGISYGVKIGAHLGVDAFVRLLPRHWERRVVLFGAFCCIAYAAILLGGAWVYISKIYSIGIPTEDLYVPRVIVEWLNAGVPGYDYEAVPIARWIPYAALPIGLTLLLFRFAQATWQIVTGRRAVLIAGHEAEEAVAEIQHAHDLKR